MNSPFFLENNNFENNKMIKRNGDDMDYNNSSQAYRAGDIVYVLYRNPHTQNVANIQEAAVVHNPEQPGGLALFLYETYYPLSDEMAVYASQAEAEQAYQYYFGDELEVSFE
ncbi:Transcriptional regulator protein (SplA) [compost metagenome]